MTSTPKRSIRRRQLLAGSAALAGSSLLGSPLAFAQKKGLPEKEVLKFGFIKLTDCAPLVIAYEKHFFEDEGLNVTLEAQANWKVLLDRVVSGELDGAHMLAETQHDAALALVEDVEGVDHGPDGEQPKDQPA